MHRRSRGTYGSPRVFTELRARGVRVEELLGAEPLVDQEDLPEDHLERRRSVRRSAHLVEVELRWSFLSKSMHTHHALDEAREQEEIFAGLRKCPEKENAGR